MNESAAELDASDPQRPSARDRFLAWLDQPRDMLDGDTPREAVGTPLGRRRVVRLIDEWESMTAHHPHPGADFAALRSLLGLMGGNDAYEGDGGNDSGWKGDRAGGGPQTGDRAGGDREAGHRGG